MYFLSFNSASETARFLQNLQTSKTDGGVYVAYMIEEFDQMRFTIPHIRKSSRTF